MAPNNALAPNQELSVGERLAKALADGHKLNGAKVMALIREAAKTTDTSMRQINKEMGWGREMEDEEEVEVIEFEYKGKTYWREDEEGADVWGGDFNDPDEVGKWVGDKIVFNDDFKCHCSKYFTHKNCNNECAPYRTETRFQWCKFNGKLCDECWKPFLEHGQK